MGASDAGDLSRKGLRLRLQSHQQSQRQEQNGQDHLQPHSQCQHHTISGLHHETEPLKIPPAGFHHQEHRAHRKQELAHQGDDHIAPRADPQPQYRTNQPCKSDQCQIGNRPSTLSDLFLFLH